MGIGLGVIAGITEAVAAIGEAFAGAGAFIAGGLGLDATVGSAIGLGLEGATIGGLGGGALNAITGKPILPGIAEGALVGGAVGGLGPAIGSATGLGATTGDVLAGAGAGALGGATIPRTGGPLEGALGGAAAGLTAGILGGPDTGASFDSLSPATGGTLGGPIDAGAFDVPTTSIAPGVESTGPLSAASPASGITSPTAPGPGPGSLAFTPPSQSVGSALDPTAVGAQPSTFSELSPVDAANFRNFQSTSVPTGTVSLGADVTAPAAPSSDGFTPGAQGTFPGQTGGPEVAQANLDAVQAEGGLVGGQPPSPPFGGAVGADIKGAIGSAGDFLNSPTGKLVGPAVSGLSLLKNIATPPNLPTINLGTIPGVAQLQQLSSSLGGNVENAGSVASRASGQARVLEDYLTTGTLPPAIQASLDQATHDAEIKIKASYAQRGMPPGSSSEIADINALKQNAVVQGGTLAATLFSQGVGLDTLASQIYNNLVGASSGASGTLTSAGVQAGTTNAGLITNENNQLNQAIANLASSLGGGNRIINNGTTVAAA